MSFTRAQVADACRKYGSMLWLPLGAAIDGPLLLWAMSGNESTFGAHVTPRHEPAYCTGIYSHSPGVIALTEKYSHAAHCSYGPWQILLVNCDVTATPKQLLGDIGLCAVQTVNFLNRRILHALGAQTIEQVGIAWNSGTLHHPAGLPNGVARYAEDLRGYYDHESMPAAPASVVAEAKQS
jgi:hypothetical protein